MLILSRREAESVCLGDDIVLTIVAVGNDKVRVGVKAPPGVRILRNELEIDLSTLPFALPATAQPASPAAISDVEPAPPLPQPALAEASRTAPLMGHVLRSSAFKSAAANSAQQAPPSRRAA